MEDPPTTLKRFPGRESFLGFASEVRFQALHLIQEFLGGWKTVGRILFETTQEDRFQQGRQSDGVRPSGSALQDPGHRSERRLAFERMTSRGQLVQENAERENVGAEIGFLTLQLFRSHVDGGSQNGSGLGQTLALRGFECGKSQTEVDDFQIAFDVQ